MIEHSTEFDPTDSELISLREVKWWLGLTGDFADDNESLRSVMIPAAAEHLSTYTGRSYVRRKHTVSASMFNDLRFNNVAGDVTDVTLSLYGTDETLSQVDALRYRVERAGNKLFVDPIGDGFPAIESDRRYPVVLEFKTAEILSRTAKTAIKSLVQIRMVNRGDDWTEKIPPSVRGLMDSLVIRRAFG